MITDWFAVFITTTTSTIIEIVLFVFKCLGMSD